MHKRRRCYSVTTCFDSVQSILSPSAAQVDFGQFVISMMTYALFETVEILKFCFFMFDKDKNGFIHKVRMPKPFEPAASWRFPFISCFLY